MKTTTLATLTLLFFSLLLSAACADDQPATIRITLENASLRKNYFEITDAICGNSLSNECKLAQIMATSPKCGNPKWKEECAKSREIADSADCLAGLLFNGWLDSGETVQLRICTDRIGKGRVRTRNSQTAPWTLHSGVEADETISVK